MAGARKDPKGRVLLKGESYRESEKRYHYSYFDAKGKRRFLYAKDLVTLRKKEEEVLKNSLDGIDSERASRSSLNNIYDKYIATRTDLDPRTRGNYMNQYDAHVRNTIGLRKVKNIKYSDILVFYIGLMEQDGLSFSSVEYLHRSINPSFQLAVRDNIIRDNPCTGVMAQLKRQKNTEPGIRSALSEDEQSSFIQFMDGHETYGHWKSIFIIFLGTGMRVGELTGLRWEDVDLENRVIHVDHAIQYFAGKRNPSKQKVFVSTPKTYAGIRNIPVIPEVKEAFLKIKEYQEKEDLKCTSEIDGYSNFIFLNRFGAVQIQYNLDRALDRIIKAHNEYATCKIKNEKKEAIILPKFTCHTLRHTFCARLCEHESNIKVIQSIMGHVDIETTMNIYAEVSEKKKQESLDIIADKLHLF